MTINDIAFTTIEIIGFIGLIPLVTLIFWGLNDAIFDYYDNKKPIQFTITWIILIAIIPATPKPIIIEIGISLMRIIIRKWKKTQKQRKNIQEQAIRYQQQQPHKETYEEFKARREREQAEQQNNNGGYSTLTVFSGVAAVSTLTGLVLPILAAGLL